MRKIFTNTPSTLTFCPLQKLLVMTEPSIHGKFSTNWDVLLCKEQTTDVLSQSTSV